MKRPLLFTVFSIALLGMACSVQAEEKEAKPPEKKAVRIGVYDSRAVAYVQISSVANLKKINAMVTEAQAAQKSKDKKKAEELAKKCSEGQKKAHRQVFSTAPIDEILEEIKDRLPEIEKKAGVSVLISKWDEKKLKEYPDAEKIDVTEQLVGEFKPTEKQRKILDEIKKAKPVSLEEAEQCK
jgi:hypothetical protein